MKVFKIEAGYFNADGGACFGVVPKRVWQRRYPCDEQNFCKLVMRCLLVDSGEKLILIDTGTGTKQSDYLKLYGIKEIVNFSDELAKLGYKTTDITDVVLTHLHFDHCGACTQFGEDGKSIELSFPNATHWVGEAQWQNFLNPNVREGDSYFSENMLPVLEAGKLKLVDKTIQLCDGFKLKVFHGHTVGQLVSYISIANKTLVYVGDVIPTSVNVPLAWISAYDTYPVEAMGEKKILLDEAIREKQYLVFEHDAYVECCTVEEINGKYKVLETMSLDSLI